VDAHRDEAVALLKRVVDIPSATQNVEGVRAVGKVFEAEFKRIGFETRWEEMPPGMRRAGHLVAEHKGTLGKRLLLIGHLDTVLEGRRFEPYVQGSQHRARGIGALDMKGGDVVVLGALQALSAAETLENRRVVVILTGDEEDAGMPISASRGPMIELARRSDLALAFEAAVDDTATVARRGVTEWTLRVDARTGHSSAILTRVRGAGAVFEAARIIDGFRREVTGEKNLTLNPSLFLAGTEVDFDRSVSKGSASGKTNVVAGTAVVQGDLRFISPAQRAAAEEKMRAIVAKSLPRTSAELEFHGEYPAMPPTPGNYATLAVLDRASRDLGLGPIKPYDPGQRGAGDIAFVAHLVDGLDGLGVYGANSHSTGEWVDLDSVPAQTKRAALLIDRLTREDAAQ
jgi:glutamate carboxypeptidase